MFGHLCSTLQWQTNVNSASYCAHEKHETIWQEKKQACLSQSLRPALMSGSSSPQCKRKSLILETPCCVCVARETGRVLSGQCNSSSPAFDVATWTCLCCRGLTPFVYVIQKRYFFARCVLMWCNGEVFFCVGLWLSGEYYNRCVTYSRHRDRPLRGGCCTTGGIAPEKESFLFIESQQLFVCEGFWLPCSSDTSNPSHTYNPHWWVLC